MATKAKDETTAYVATRNAETALGSFTHGETVYLNARDEVVKGLVETGNIVTLDDFLAANSPEVLLQMERETGVVPARESGPGPTE